MEAILNNLILTFIKIVHETFQFFFFFLKSVTQNGDFVAVLYTSIFGLFQKW